MPRKQLGQADENRKRATRLFDDDIEECDVENDGISENGGLRVRLNGKKDRPSARAYAVKLLAFKTYTERGLREKLKAKEYTSSEIDEAVDYAKGQGFINDALIAQNALEKLSVKYGKRRIFAYLSSKGISREVLDTLDDSEIDFKENARALALKMAAKGKPYEKIAASLSRAGFSSSEIYYAMAGTRLQAEN